jgi:hypothetical protein
MKRLAAIAAVQECAAEIFDKALPKIISPKIFYPFGFSPNGFCA